jgi:DNA polymerase-1
LGQVLFERLNLPVMRKTKTGFSTDSDVLEKLQLQHPIASLLLEYRELAKLKSTYVDALPNLMDPKDGRIHTHYRQALTTTGRLSSVNPNLQNIPIRTARGRMIRKAFIAKQGCVLISADYSQIELRILAHMSDDPGLVHAFQQNLDIHAATASEIFNVPLKEVTSEQRRAAKAVNFGIAYGQGAYGLSQGLGISRAEAADVIRRYFLRFPNVRQFMDDMVHTGNEKGYVETLFGRRRYLPELKSKNQAIKKFGERAAINAPMQGTASDLVKLAMIHLHQDASVPILLQVHDELIFECPVAKQADEIKIIKKIMEHVFELKVPLVVDISSGHSWESQMDSA